MISINNFFYYTNYGVIQGFPALRKAVTTHVKKYDILFTCVWYRQSDTDMSHAFPPLGQVDEWTAKPSPFSIHGRLSEYFRINYGCYKTEISVLTLTDSEVQTFLEREENQNTKWKTESYVFSGFGNGISRDWERKSTTERFATGQFWPFTWMISSVGKDQFSNWEFCSLKIRPIVCFRSDSTHVFILSAPTYFTICILDCWSFYFHSLTESTFLVSKRLLRSYDKQNST